jgi:hypothetical protein
MAKYYIKSGSLELIYSTSKSPIHAAVSALWETNENDVIDEYFYVDERGMKDYKTADKETIVIESQTILDMAGWEAS